MKRGGYGLTVAGLLAALLVSPAVLAESHGKKQGGDKHSFMQRLDSDGDGKISREEYQEVVNRKFDRMDANGDDQIDEDEWQQAREKMKEHMREHRKSGADTRSGGNQ